jgi:hypothetical protein
MFDFEKEEMQEAAPVYQYAEWDEITKNHAEREHDATRDAAIKNQGKREAFENFYEGRHSHRKERIAVDSGRYALLAIGLTVLGYAVRSISWLGITLGLIALGFGLVAAYGAGKYSEM